MDLFIRMVERGGLHFVASTFVFIGLYFLAVWLQKKRPDLICYIFAGSLVVATMSLHEIYDLGVGADPLSKAFTDVLSWALGCGASAYAVYRLRKK